MQWPWIRPTSVVFQLTRDAQFPEVFRSEMFGADCGLTALGGGSVGDGWEAATARGFIDLSSLVLCHVRSERFYFHRPSGFLLLGCLD